MASISLQPRRAELAAALSDARIAPDVAAIHRLRVAAARCDVWLRMAGWNVLRSDLRRIRRAAGEVRELDLLRNLELPLALATWAESEHRDASAALAVILEEKRTLALLEALAVLPPLPRSAATRFMERELEHLLRLRERALRADASAGDLHATRRALRRMRFAGEWLGRKRDPPKRLLRDLGHLNDVVVAIARVRNAPDREPSRDLLAAWSIEAKRRIEHAQGALRRAKLDLRKPRA